MTAKVGYIDPIIGRELTADYDYLAAHDYCHRRDGTTPLEYSFAIEAAKLDPSYFQSFGKFTLRRTPETLAVDTNWRTDNYSLTVDTQALNKRLQESVKWGLK